LNVFKMSLFEEHKTERRARIRAAAKKLLATHGYEGLTMRELAAEARVSVPTLYNLFGSKDAILVAELEASAVRLAGALPVPGTTGYFARGMVAFELGTRLIEEEPALFRAAMTMFLTSPDAQPMRARVEDGYIAIMQANLAAAKAAGQLADWAEPAIVARHMFAQYMSAFLAWGVGDLDLAEFRLAALSGICHLLAGVTRGEFAADVEARLRELAPETLRFHHRSKEDRHVRTRD
jgi:AcrR family transcriptional regulator